MTDLMVSGGYKAAGYEYVIIDDCWLAETRAADGQFVGLRPALEGFVVTMHEGACETGSQIPTA